MECWFQEGQAAWPAGVLAPQPGPAPQYAWSSPALPYPALRWDQPSMGRAWSYPWRCSLSLCYGMEVLRLAKFPEPQWGIQGRQGKEGKPTDHRRKPRQLSWHLGPGHPVQPQPVSHARRSAPPRNTLVHAGPSAWNALTLPLILQDSLKYHLLGEAFHDLHWGTHSVVLLEPRPLVTTLSIYLRSIETGSSLA